MCGTAGAEDEGGGMLGLQEWLEGGEECGCVGVVSDETAFAHFDAVDGTDGGSGFIQVVEIGDDGLFVRNGDIKAADVVVRHPLPQIGEEGHGIESVAGTGDAFVLEHVLEPTLGPRVTEWIADESVLFHGAKIVKKNQ